MTAISLRAHLARIGPCLRSFSVNPRDAAAAAAYLAASLLRADAQARPQMATAD